MVVGSIGTGSSWSFRPDAWAIRSCDTSIGFAQLVGIVEAHRASVKANRAAGVSAST